LHRTAPPAARNSARRLARGVATPCADRSRSAILRNSPSCRVHLLHFAFIDLVTSACRSSRSLSVSRFAVFSLPPPLPIISCLFLAEKATGRSLSPAKGSWDARWREAIVITAVTTASVNYRSHWDPFRSPQAERVIWSALRCVATRSGAGADCEHICFRFSFSRRVHR